jgi:hypothetical protein
VFDTRGVDRHLAVAATEDQLPALAAALGLTQVNTTSVAAALAELEGGVAEQRLQEAGIAAAVVADASDTVTDPQLWWRRYFEMRHATADGVDTDCPHCGAAWGGNASGLAEEPHDVGADNVAVLREIGGLDDEEIARLTSSGAIGRAATGHSRRPESESAIRITRGELSRVDDFGDHTPWEGLLAGVAPEGGGEAMRR